MLITILTSVFSKFFPFIFFWANLAKFFNFTEISYRGTLLYTYYDFNVCFFKIFVIHIFWVNLVPKSEVLQINWNLAYGYITMWLLQSQCLFFRNFCHSYFSGKFGPKIWSSSDWLKLGAEVDCDMLVSILMFIFSKVLSFI